MKPQGHLKECRAWQELSAHQHQLATTNLTALFAEDTNRFKNFSFQLDTFLVDFSKNLMTDKTLRLLLQLAEERKVAEWIHALMKGEKINQSENRAAWHSALRQSNGSAEVRAVLEKIEQFEKKFRQQHFTEIVHIGVGGSDLGPRLVVEACRPLQPGPLTVHFVSCLDGEQAAHLMQTLNPEKTLIIIASKSFTTLDTLSNARTLCEWLKKYVPASWQKQVIGISANAAAMTEFGILPDNQFLFWEWVGGRFSVWSAVGMVIALALGFTEFKHLLEGAEIVDQHFKNVPFNANIPVLMGLISVWYNNFWNVQAQAILPYSSRLALLPAYLQQLEMESCGKRVTQENKITDYATGYVTFGEVGSRAQHAFVQLLQQGTLFVPVDFIVPLQHSHGLENYDKLTLANALAQARALMIGNQLENVALQQVCAGNKPSTTILIPKVTPKSIGMLLALYEHKIVVQSIIWGINPFDQWGVELGKNIAKEIYALLSSHKKPLDDLDASTHGLLDYATFVS